MPKHGQSIRRIERIEDVTAVAVSARHHLDQLSTALANLHKQGRALSSYNLETAQCDIAEARAALSLLQSELCKFRSPHE